MHLFAIVIGADPLKEASGTFAPVDHTHVEFYWADDEEHAIEQAQDANRQTTGVPYLTAIVPDDYVRKP